MDTGNIKRSLEAQCSKREYCASDVLRKALKRIQEKSDNTGEPVDAEAEAKKLLEGLVEDGFVSDLRYACAFARDKSSLTGWGPVKIRFALRAKRISDQIIDEALGDTDRDRADDKLLRLIQAKYKTLKEDPQVRLKLLKYALGRGYEYDTVSETVEKVLRGED